MTCHEGNPLPTRPHQFLVVRAIALLSLLTLLSACSLHGSHGATPTPANAASASPVAVASPIVLASPDGGETLLAQPTAVHPHTSGDQTLTLAGSAHGPLTLDPALLRDVESAFLARQIFRG